MFLKYLKNSKEGLVYHFEILPPLGKSDHGVIMFTVQCSYQRTLRKSYKMLFNRGNYEAIRRELDINWDDLFKDQSVHQCWDIFKDKVADACKTHIPIVDIHES